MKVSVNIKMDEEIRDKSKELFNKLGLDMTTAVNMFLIQAIRQNQIPFQLKATTDEEEIEKIERIIYQKMQESESLN
jgi:DNA-damage-inducible protein J